MERTLQLMKWLILILSISFTFAQTKDLSDAVEKANQLYDAKKYQSAYEEYSKLLKRYPGNEYLLYNLGNTQFQMKNYEAARTSYISAFNFTDTLSLSELNYNIGNTYLFESKVDTAISYYKRALELNDQDKDAKWNLELAQAILKEKSKKQQQQQQNENNQNKPSKFAKELFERAKKLASEFRFKEAFDLMNKGLKQDPTVQAFQDFIGKLKKVTELLQ